MINLKRTSLGSSKILCNRNSIDCYKLGNLFVIPDVGNIIPGAIINSGLDHIFYKRVHIFVNSDDFMDEQIQKQISMIHPFNKIIFHVWKNMIELEKLMVNHGITKLHPHIKIIHDNPDYPIYFAIPGLPGSAALKVSQSFEYITLTGSSFQRKKVKNPITLFELISFMHRFQGDYFIDYNDSNSRTFITTLEQKYANEFKEELIANFKKCTPSGILKAFKTDDDIWDYIMMTNDWSPDGPGKKQIITGTMQNKINQFVGNAIQGIKETTQFQIDGRTITMKVQDETDHID